MDDRGFIFTTDAILALVIFMVFSASFLTYYALPSYLGQDHMHLETIADDALDTMYQDGTLYAAAVKYASNDTTGADTLLRESLNYLIPSDTAYRLTMGTYSPVTDDRGLAVAKDTATRVRVISGPREGWLGRAWYKVETVEFENQQHNVTTTLWNFHNWLTNFRQGEYGSWYYQGLYNDPYWGKWNSPQEIEFSIPDDAVIGSGTFLLGSSNSNNNTSYAANVVINGVAHNNITPFTFLNYRPPQTGPPIEKMYNYQGTIDASTLNLGVNNFYVNFLNMVSSQVYNMPWFALLGNYTATFQVPKGILTNRTNFPDAAGMAVPNPQELDGNNTTTEYGRIYDLNTGNVSSLYNRRVINWNDLEGHDHGFDDGLPFVIGYLPTGSSWNPENGSAVSIVQDVYIPTTDSTRILDASVTINAYGAVDNALVEVWNEANGWRTVFRSFGTTGSTTFPSYSARSDGYGNIPGTIAIGGTYAPYLMKGNNKVRITVWDQVPSTDYDLVGLVDCYTTVSYTNFAITWDNPTFSSYQDSDNYYTQNRTFQIGPDAKKVYMFTSVGGDTRHIKLEVRNSSFGNTWATLYDSDTVPYLLDVAALDAAGPHRFTTGTPGNYTIKPIQVRTQLTVTAGESWESGDGASSPLSYANAELYSGTRFAILYPQFLANEWADALTNDPETAKQQAKDKLIAELASMGITVDPSLIKTEALYTGNAPNSIPVRLDLWKN